jgi:tetratricopeptide (TPR) repeat protein
MRNPRGVGLKVAGLAFSALLVAACASTVSRSDLATEYYNLGNAYYELERFSESARYLARAHDLDPTLVRASYNLARAYVELERYSEAIDLLEDLLLQDPENAMLIETQAYAYYRQGRVEEAAELYDAAIERSPTDVDLLQNRAEIARLQEDYARAAELLERVIVLAPEENAVLRTTAETFELAGQIDDAIRMMRSYVAAEPDDAAGARYLAELLAIEARYADALAVLERVLEDESIDERERASAGFAKAEILLTAAEEAELGLQALTEAVALGFGDREAAEALLSRDELLAREAVTEVLQTAGLIGGEGDSAGEQSPSEQTEDGAESEAPAPSTEQSRR